MSSEQRKKIIRKLLRSVRVAAAPHFAEIASETGLHDRTIRKIYNHFVQGLPWGDVGRLTDPKHDPRLVACRIEELKAHYAAEQRAKGGVGTLSNRSCAKLLDIKWGTFARILKKIATLRSTDITFSRDPNFLKKLLRHIRLALYSVLATMSSLAHPSVTGALMEMLRKGRKVIVLADQEMLLSKYSRPRIEELMKAGIPVYYQKQASRDQHQNVIIVDDVAVSVGSANASLKAADFDFENIVYLYSEDDVGVFKQEFDLEVEGDCALLTPEWLDAKPPKEDPEEHGSERVLPEDSSLVPPTRQYNEVNIFQQQARVTQLQRIASYVSANTNALTLTRQPEARPQAQALTQRLHSSPVTGQPVTGHPRRPKDGNDRVLPEDSDRGRNHAIRK